MRKWHACICLLLMLMIPVAALAQTDAPTVERKGLALGEGYVYYPQVTGMADAQVQQLVNDALLTQLNAAAYIDRLALTMQSPVPLQVDYTVWMQGDVLSCVMLASGPVQGSRATQVWTCTNVDLRTGESITWDMLFSDPAAAEQMVTELMDFEVAPEMSAHLRNCELTPLPVTFSLSDTALTLHYPIERLCTLSDRAGTVVVQWSVVKDVLRTDPDAVPVRIGAVDNVTADDTTRGRIAASLQQGGLSGVPALLGDSVQDWVDRCGLLADPDLYEGGRMIQLEDGVFRGVYLLTDSLTEDFANSTVQGLRSDRIDLHGLCTGVTRREEWQALLGQPDASVELDPIRADAYRLVSGVSDYYRFDSCQLRLHADENGVLVSVFLTN